MLAGGLLEVLELLQKIDSTPYGVACSINGELFKVFLYPSGLILSTFFVLQTSLWGTKLFPWLSLTLHTPLKKRDPRTRPYTLIGTKDKYRVDR